MARVTPLTAAVNEAPAKTEAELVEEELAHDKAVRQSKAVTLKDKDFMQIYKDNQKKFNLVPKKKKKVWDGKVNVDRKVVDNVKVVYSKEDFLDMYEQKYQVSDEDDSDTVSEDDYEIDSAAAESSKVEMPSANIAHKELATTTNPKGKTAEEQEVFALAGTLAGTKKLDEKLYKKDEKRLKKQKRKQEIEELTQDDTWFVKFRRIICCQKQPGHKRSLKEEQMFLYHIKNEDMHAVKRDLDQRSDPNFRDRDGKTALILACFMGSSGIANNLIRFGADVNLKDFENGWTALHYVAMRGYRDR